MWSCPKCGREFKNTNQSHYCAYKPDTIDDYIKQSPPEHQEVLQKIRQTVKEVAPDSLEKITWSMPTFFQGENLLQFAVHKKHLGLYPGVEAVVKFSKKLDKLGFFYSKGSIQLPWSKPFPYELLTEITEFRVKQAKKVKGK